MDNPLTPREFLQGYDVTREQLEELVDQGCVVITDDWKLVRHPECDKVIPQKPQSA